MLKKCSKSGRTYTAKSSKNRNRNKEFNAPKQILLPPVHLQLKALKTKHSLTRRELCQRFEIHTSKLRKYKCFNPQSGRASTYGESNDEPIYNRDAKHATRNDTDLIGPSQKQMNQLKVRHFLFDKAKSVSLTKKFPH